MDCKKLRYFNLGQYKNSTGVTSFSKMFLNATSIEFLDLTDLVTNANKFEQHV